MRLICPNCDAEYEVDGDQISSEGRDVQCSNCAQTWLQMPEGVDDVTGIETPDEAEIPELDAEEIADESADDEDVTAGESNDEADDEADADFTPPAGAEMQSARKTTDPDALNVLHEEVQHEMRHRDAETGGIETQTELGLDQSDFAPTPTPLPPIWASPS